LPAHVLSLDETLLHQIGHEAIKIARVQLVFDDSAAVIEEAAAQRFSQINPHYPGIRASVSSDLLRALCTAVEDIAVGSFGAARQNWMGQAWYSIVTQTPGRLTPIQRLPHFDGFKPDQVAIMIYLNQTRHGGTGFYRHKSTGFESVSQARYPEYKASLEKDVKSTGLPPAKYITDGAPHFERIADLGAEFNSMIVYPGTALHSGVIDNHVPLHKDPREGRLTINGFFAPA